MTWENENLSSTLTKINLPKDYQILSSEIMPEGLYPVIDQGQSFIAGYSNISNKVISENLPLIVFGDHTRIVKYIDFPFIIGADGTKLLKPKEDYDPKYYYFALLSTNVPNRGYNRHFSLLKEKSIPKPPLTEQRKIAAVLSTVQNAIETQTKLIERTTELKKAMMHKLFTEGTRGEKQKMTEIGLVPESWEVVRFFDYVSITNGQVNPKESPYNGMIHVGPENIESNTGRLIKLQTNEQLGIKSGNYYFSKDDILYSKIRPYLNKVALPDFEGTCSADMYPLKSNENSYSRSFLFQLLLSVSINQQTILHQDRTGIPKINRNQLGSILLIKPSLKEQIQIADSLSAIDNKLNIHRNKKQKLEELFRNLLHKLMTAEIRVDVIELKLH